MSSLMRRSKSDKLSYFSAPSSQTHKSSGDDPAKGMGHDIYLACSSILEDRINLLTELLHHPQNISIKRAVIDRIDVFPIKPCQLPSERDKCRSVVDDSVN